MNELTSRERMARILRREPVDRVAVGESFWGDTRQHWIEQGHIREDESLLDHFRHDYVQAGWANVAADPEYQEQIIEEDEESKLVRNANGAHLRYWKGKSGTPEHVHFEVTDRRGWEETIRPWLTDEGLLRKRINVEAYRQARQDAADRERFFFANGVNVFECMHPVCGHEHMLVGMALDPDWVRDMCEVYSDLLIKTQEIMFAEGGVPDGVWYYEDMGFKAKPFMSPAMYTEIVWPAHQKTFDFAHSHGLPVVVHSCGYVEQLVPGLIEAGMDCLQAMEVKAGMDLVKLKKEFGDKIAFCGGMDIRALESNDTAKVDDELRKKLPIAMDGSGYILHTDHSVSTGVEYATYRYFVDRGREIGTYR